MAFDIERTNRFDFIAEEFNANGVRLSGRKDIQNAAVNGEFTRQFDGGDSFEPAENQPVREFRQWKIIAYGNGTRRRLDGGSSRNRLQQGWQTGDDRGRPSIGLRESAYSGDSGRVDRVARINDLGKTFPGREQQDAGIWQVCQFVDKFFGVTNRRQNNQVGSSMIG